MICTLTARRLKPDEAQARLGRSAQLDRIGSHVQEVLLDGA